MIPLRALRGCAERAAYPYVLAIEAKATGRYIGHVGFSEIDDGVEIGFGIGAEHRRQGYAREAVSAFLQKMMPVFGLPLVYGIVDPENLTSIRVLQCAGFVYTDMKAYGGVGKKVYCRLPSAAAFPS